MSTILNVPWSLRGGPLPVERRGNLTDRDIAPRKNPKGFFKATVRSHRLLWSPMANLAMTIEGDRVNAASEILQKNEAPKGLHSTRMFILTQAIVLSGEIFPALQISN